MKNNCIASDSICNIVICNVRKNLQGMTNNAKVTVGVGDTTCAILQLVSSKTNRRNIIQIRNNVLWD